MSAGHDGPAQGEGPAQQPRHLLYVAGGQGLTYGRGANLLAVLSEELGRLHTEAHVAADLTQHADRTLAVAAKGEIGADIEEAHAQLLDEEGGEIAGGELRQLRGKGDDAHAVRPQQAQELQPLFQAGQVGDGGARPEHGRRVRVEHDDHRGESLRMGALDEVGDEVLMAAVNAVELADGDSGVTTRRDAAQRLAGEGDAHCRAASSMARMFSGGVWGSMEHSGARRKRRPPVSSSASRASAATSAGEPFRIVCT